MVESIPKSIGNRSVVRLLGTGGMGNVYLVRDDKTKTEYAAKTLRRDISEKQPDFVERFKREAMFAQRIRHPNLVAVYDYGFDEENGCHYIIMEYVSGGNLSDLLRKKGKLPIPEAVEITRQVAYGLAAAHQHGVVHRDIKPDNILFSNDGLPKLADLGVAKFSDQDPASTQTQSGTLLGTPAYMAPE